MPRLKYLVGSMLYWACYILAVVFLAVVLWVLFDEASDSPAMACGFSLALALLIFGFGWSGRRLLHGQE